MKAAEKIAKLFPGLKFRLGMAGLKETPEQFVKRLLKVSITFTILFEVIILLFTKFNFLISLLSAPIIYILCFFFFSRIPDVYAKKRAQEMDAEVLFAARYIMLKIQSGVPLLNSMIDASRGYGIAGKYFGEIVQDVSTGASIEEALEYAIKYSPSKNFKKLLEQLMNALKTGANISDTLKAMIHDVTEEQIIEIKKYGRKLNPLTMFYMVLACVAPSLGVAMLVVVASFISLQIDLKFLLILIFFLIFLQFMFVSIFRTARPAVGI